MNWRRRLELPREVWQEFGSDNGTMVAAAVSFYEFLALFPLLLAAVGVLGMVLGSPEHAADILKGSIGQFLAGPQTKGIIEGVIRGSRAATGVGIILLLWSGISAMSVLEQAMNTAWNVQQKRGIVRSKIAALISLVGAAVLVLLSLGLTAGVRAIRQAGPEAVARIGILWTTAGYVVGTLLSIALFVWLYKLLPNTRVNWRAAVIAGTFAGVLWEIAKQAFTYYVVHFAGYNKVYGPLSSVIILMIWINYSAVITVLGAELGAVWQRRRVEQRA